MFKGLLSNTNLVALMTDLTILENQHHISEPAADLSLSTFSTYLINLTTEDTCSVEITLQFSEHSTSEFYDEIKEHNLGNTITTLDGTPIELPYIVKGGSTQLLVSVITTPDSSELNARQPDKPFTRFSRIKIKEVGLGDLKVTACLIQSPLHLPRGY